MLSERRIAWTSIDHDGSPARVIPKTDFMYVRLIGKYKRFDYLGEEQINVSDRLRWWTAQLAPHAADMKRVFVMAGNDFSG